MVRLSWELHRWLGPSLLESTSTFPLALVSCGSGQDCVPCVSGLLMSRN